jgi:hypothetical protein
MFVCCDCYVLSGRGLCDELITRPEESYRLWCVVCDLETSRMRRPWSALGGSTTANKKKSVTVPAFSDSNSLTYLKICSLRFFKVIAIYLNYAKFKQVLIHQASSKAGSFFAVYVITAFQGNPCNLTMNWHRPGMALHRYWCQVCHRLL